jgi:hypothetical protein
MTQPNALAPFMPVEQSGLPEDTQNGIYNSLGVVRDIVGGEDIGTFFYQVDALSDEGIKARKVFINNLSHILHADLSRSLALSEQPGEVTLDSYDNGPLGLEDPEVPKTVGAQVRSVHLTDKRTRRSISVEEKEFSRPSVDGSTQSTQIMRIISCIPYGQPPVSSEAISE